MLKPSHYTIGSDAHKHYSIFAVRDGNGQLIDLIRINHERDAIKAFLSQFMEGIAIALENVGDGPIPVISGLLLNRRRD